MKNISKKILTKILYLQLLTAPIFAFAQEKFAIDNPLKGGNNLQIPDLIKSLLGYVVKVGVVVAIFAFVWTGFLFVQAQGNAEGLKKAKTVFKNTCIGVAVLLGAQLIASLIVGTLQSLK